MPKRALFVDFDRTLFDTALFSKRLWSWLEQAYGLDKAAEHARSRQFCHYQAEMYDYDFFAHIESCGLDKNEVNEAAHRAIQESFLFADATGCLALSPHILTYGNEPYQRFKLSFCPQLSHVPVTIVREPKDRYLARCYAADVTLVDDKLIIPTPQIRFIHLDRLQPAPVSHHEGYDSVNSLDNVPRLLDT